MRTRYLTFVLILGAALFFFPLSLPAMEKQAETLDELLGMFDESSCMDCHDEMHNEWSDSWHAQSVVSSLGGMHNFIEIGLAKEWETPLTKAQILKCLDCHAPVVNFASEKLAVEIGGMIVTAFKEKGKPSGDAAKKELAKLNVGCLSCHNIKATGVARGFNGPAEKGMIYGPNGEDAGDAHETLQANDITRSAFCMQCHGVYMAADGETIQCNTLSGSYRNAYVANGGSQTCQDCHMKKGHLFPGGHDLDTVKEGLGFVVQIDPYKHLPGQVKGVKDPKKWVPSAVVNVFIENKAGHRVPDG
jgi:nitrate/TMAO reductase-like tetraheme cytochrome c subunit